MQMQLALRSVCWKDMGLQDILLVLELACVSVRRAAPVPGSSVQGQWHGSAKLTDAQGRVRMCFS